MKVEQLMQRSVRTCRPDDPLERATQLMWEHDCGAIVVVDDAGRAVGMVTDRDACMAAYTQGKPLSALPVSAAMSQTVQSCRPADTVAEAARIMQAAQVRRLPVVGDGDATIGVLSLNDIARQAVRDAGSRKSGRITAGDVAGTLAAVCAPRPSRSPAPAAA
jgi:CBS domain-containing protein